MEITPFLIPILYLRNSGCRDPIYSRSSKHRDSPALRKITSSGTRIGKRRICAIAGEGFHCRRRPTHWHVTFASTQATKQAGCEGAGRARCFPTDGKPEKRLQKLIDSEVRADSPILFARGFSFPELPRFLAGESLQDLLGRTAEGMVDAAHAVAPTRSNSDPAGSGFSEPSLHR